MAYKLTNGLREEPSDATDYDTLLSEARAWAACTHSDVSVIDLSDGKTLLTVSHLDGSVR